MLSSSRLLATRSARLVLIERRQQQVLVALRSKSTLPEQERNHEAGQQALNPNGDVPSRTQEVIRFPVKPEDTIVKEETTPVLLNAKEHVVGYLSKILNARCYDACVETDLQEAKNLSAVRVMRNTEIGSYCYILLKYTYGIQYSLSHSITSFALHVSAPQEYSASQARRHAACLFVQNSRRLQ